MKLQKEREEIEKEKAKLIALKSGKGKIYKDAFSLANKSRIRPDPNAQHCFLLPINKVYDETLRNF